MRRLVWQGGRRFCWDRSENGQQALGPGQALVRVRAVGICGTDIHILKGALPWVRPPLVLGHEIAGEIATVGPGVEHLREGDRVTIDSVVGCGKCPDCLRSKPQFCREGFEYGVTMDGGCQEFLVVPATNAHVVPSSVSDVEAAILDIEVWRAIQKCGVDRGDRVLILGAGPIGLIAAQVVRVLGAAQVLLAEPDTDRRLAAERSGFADQCISADREERDAAVAALTDGRGMDLTIDCAGNSSSVAAALDCVRPCGRVLLYGVHEKPAKLLDLNQIVIRDLVVYGALSDRCGWADVIRLVDEERIRLRPLITHEFPFADAERAYELVRRREDGVVKAVLVL